MSVYFDSLWWWRQEFGHQANPYTDQPSTSLPIPTTQPITVPESNMDLEIVTNLDPIDLSNLPDLLGNPLDTSDWQWGNVYDWQFYP
jgi:hypothetical protein